MAQSKFEKHIKRQLKEREIQPSDNAWSKLNDLLDETVVQKRSKSSYFWYAVAACLVGLVIVSAVLFSTTTSISKTNIQVVEDSNGVDEEVDDMQKIKIQENAVEVVSTERIPEKQLKQKVVKASKVVSEKQDFTEELSDTSTEVRIQLDDASEKIVKTKVLQLIAQVDTIEQNSDALSDAEVDSLLRKAQEELLRNKLFRNDHSVDAMALLTEVEDELDKSFRDQIFESLKTGFWKVRTAVADRNN